MFSLRDFIVFLAGFEFFHTLSHLFLAFFVNLPLQTKFFSLTPSMNLWATIINGLITLVLIWWADKLSKKGKV